MEANITHEMKNLYQALAKAQSEITNPERTAKGYNYNYAPMEEVVRVARPVLAKYGLAVVQFPINDGNQLGIKTIVTHESGEALSESFTTPITKNDPQSIGSIITYYRRYSYMAVLGIAPEDDDTASVSNQQKSSKTTSGFATDKQIKLIHTLLTKKGRDAEKLKEHYGVESMRELTSAQAADAIKILNEVYEESIQ